MSAGLTQSILPLYNLCMKQINLQELKPGMVTAENIFSLSGHLLVPKGMSLTNNMIAMLYSYNIHKLKIEDSASLAADSIDDLEEDFPFRLPEEERKKKKAEIARFKNYYSNHLQEFQTNINRLVDMNSTMSVDVLLTQVLNLLDTGGKPVNFLDMLVYMREYTGDIYSHCMNVSLLCNVLAGWLQFSEADRRLAAACGMLHDIGKTKIPKEILEKPGPLTPEERRIVNRHPEDSYNILSGHNVAETIKRAALMHHEKCDGSGYPYKLQSHQIDKFAKIVTICDIYNALTSNRPFRKAMSPFSAIEYLEQDGLQKYDTQCILVFIENAANTFLHSPVLLSDGRKGTVVFLNRGHLGRPTVQCGPEFIDLRTRPDLKIVEIIPAV